MLSWVLSSKINNRAQSDDGGILDIGRTARVLNELDSRLDDKARAEFELILNFNHDLVIWDCSAARVEKIIILHQAPCVAADATVGNAQATHVVIASGQQTGASDPSFRVEA